jgi:hypothetical protein
MIASRLKQYDRGGGMKESFSERPILNSLYVYPARHWELDDEGQPSHRIAQSRWRSEQITPVPKRLEAAEVAGPRGIGVSARVTSCQHPSRKIGSDPLMMRGSHGIY